MNMKGYLKWKKSYITFKKAVLICEIRWKGEEHYLIFLYTMGIMFTSLSVL